MPNVLIKKTECTAFSQEILNSILAVTGNEKNCDSLLTANLAANLIWVASLCWECVLCSTIVTKLGSAGNKGNLATLKLGIGLSLAKEEVFSQFCQAQFQFASSAYFSGTEIMLNPGYYTHIPTLMVILEFQGPYGPLRNSSTCGGLVRFTHKSFGSFNISGNNKQRCKWPLIRLAQFIKKSKKSNNQKFDYLINESALHLILVVFVLFHVLRYKYKTGNGIIVIRPDILFSLSVFHWPSKK